MPPKTVGPAPAVKKRGRKRWIAFGVLAFAGVCAVETGWAGYGMAELRARVYPNDTALLGWIPADVASLVVVDTHQVKLDALGREGGTARTTLQRTRDDVKRATGIDLVLDVDKLIVTPALVVARGRFDGKKLADRLGDHRYALVEYRGEGYLTRAGEDAIGVIDGSIALYGDEASVKAAIEAHQTGNSLEKNDGLTARLSRVGWRHAVLGSVQLIDDKPSLRAILAGSTGPRSVTVGVATLLNGLDVDGAVESATPSAAADLAVQLEDKRKSADTVKALVGEASATQEPGAILAKIAKGATVASDGQSADVRLHAHLDPEDLEALAKNARAVLPLAQAYKSSRLLQLLMPGGERSPEPAR